MCIMQGIGVLDISAIPSKNYHHTQISFLILIYIFHSRSTTVECKKYWNLSIGNWQKIGDLLTGSKTQQCNILASALWQYR
jgi:hypothetical protein